jgi:hypothetical protein
MSQSKIIDHRFFIRLDLDHSLKANSLFQTNSINRENLANQLLIYDEIIIPTKDFGIVPILINWFGLKTFINALEHNTFSFIHTNSIIGYAGNGLGISGFKIEDGGKPFAWWQDAMFRDSSIAIDQQLRNMCPFLSRSERDSILAEILKRTIEVNYDNSFFMKDIVQETYQNDIERNSELCDFIVYDLQKRNLLKEESGSINLEKLPLITGSEMKVLNQEGRIDNSIDLVLRIAEINMELYFASICDNADLFTSDGAETLLTSKLMRSGIENDSLKHFLALFDFRNIPNVGKIVADNELPFSSFWKIREGKKSESFRKWFHKLEIKDSEEIKKLYVDSLERKSWVDSLPNRVDGPTSGN